MGFKFPYGNSQQLNLNWFIKKFKELLVDWQHEKESIDGALDAEIQRAEDALSDVYTARDTTIAAKNDALQAKADALTAAANAAQYWQNAANSASSAAGSAGTALQAAEDAETAETNAAASNTQSGVNKFMAEAWAVGTMNGTPVGSGTIQYNNNAKYYAQQASGDAAQTALDRAAVAQDKDDTDTIKDNANAAALRAEGWADGTQNGTPVASGSPYYENNAKYYKEAAEDVLESIPPDYTELADEVASQSEKIENIEDTIDGFFYAPIELTLNNGYINNNGSIHTQSTTNLEVYSDYFAVTPGEKIHITLHNPDSKANWLVVGRKNSYGNWSARSELIDTSNTQKEVEVTYTIPNTTYYLSVCYRTYGVDTVEVKREDYEFYPYEDGIELEERVTALEIGGQKKNVVRQKNKVYSTNHRGWHQCPENTLPAFKQSAVHGFGQVETDIRFTSDNVPVLLHDSTINRTARNSDGTTISEDIEISSITLSEALEYDFGIYKDSSFAGTKIPTLEDFLALCRNIGVIPYLEIEGSLSDEKIEIIADVVNASGIRNDVVFISNYTSSLEKLLTYFPSNRIGVSPWTYDGTYLQAATGMFNNKAEIFMHMSYSQVTSAILSALQEQNIPLELWVCDSATILAADTYVTGFTSNDAVASTVLYNSEINA